MKSTKKQPVKKRAYIKHAAKWTKKDHANAINDLQLVEPSFIPVSKDTEIECLNTMCSMMSNFSQEQRNRTLQFLVGKYYDFS